MGRYAKSNQTIEDLKTKIEDAGGVLDAVSLSKVSSDLKKVNFDTENLEPFGTEDSYNHLPGLENLDGYEMLGPEGAQFPVLWVAAGGDWELPLVFVLYIGQKGELRGYIPEDGNCYNKKAKAAYGNNEGDPEDWDDDPRYIFDVAKMKAGVANRIAVEGVSTNGGITFRQLIQTLKDFSDQLAAVMPSARGAEASCWGIQHIWFENGVLHLGQHDDEGLGVGLIAERIEKCVPAELLDTPAHVKVGVAEDVNSDARKILDKYGEDAKTNTVSSSEVKNKNGWFCRWVLKFA